MRTLACIALLAAAALLPGCATVGANEGVSNTPGAFSYGGQVSGKSDTQSYTWENHATKAMVSWGGQVAAGSIDVTIRDAAGTKVFSRTLSGPNSAYTGDSSGGLPGDWTIHIAFHDATANMGLSVTST